MDERSRFRESIGMVVSGVIVGAIFVIGAAIVSAVIVTATTLVVVLVVRRRDLHPAVARHPSSDFNLQ